MTGVIILFALIITSCSKNEFETSTKENIKQQTFTLSDVSVQQGILVFKNQQHFDTVKKTLDFMAPTDFANWEKSIGFIPMLSTPGKLNLNEIYFVYNKKI